MMGEANYPLGRKPDPRRVLAALRELATGVLVHGMTAAVCKDMADELEAFLTAPAEARGSQPVAWRVKDFADGWILFHSEAEARREAEGAGNLVQPLYVGGGH